MLDYFTALISGVPDDPERRTSRKDTIITFNYDLLCDDALRRLGAEPSYHVKHESRADARGAGGRNSIDLLKLHGSANWGICTKCRDDITILPEKLTHDPHGFRALVCPNCKASAYHLLLIPPSWDKSEYKDIIGRVWAKALEGLSKATRICIIGYSMPEADAFFQYLLTLALSKNDHLYKLIVVDRMDSRTARTVNAESSARTIHSLEARYRSMLDPMFQERRFSFHASGIEGFLGSDRALTELGRGEAVSGGVSYH